METNRGKKGKKAIWHLTLGLKDTIFVGIGVVGLMMMSFALGALAGRGDIYRVAYSWGLLTPDGTRVAQWLPPGVAPAPAAPAGTGAPAAQGAVAAAKPGAAPVTGSMTAAPVASSDSAKKKAKGGSSPKDHKAKEAELQKLRQEVARKLKFQNSFDSAPPKPAGAAINPKIKEHEAKAKSGAPPAPVRVAVFRDAKAARAKVAELQKQGVKASLKQGKDQKGVYYAVYRQGSQGQVKGKLAKKQNKTEPKQKADSR